MLQIDASSYRTAYSFNQRVRFLVLHYTALDFQQSIEYLAWGKNVSAHYLIPALADTTYRAAGFNEQRIFNLVDENNRAWHAGASYWAGRANLNDTSIGIEIVNNGELNGGEHSDFADYETQQIDAVIALAADILRRYPEIVPQHVVAHADIAYERKKDPGPQFPWARLYAAGIGAWYDESTKQRYEAQFIRNGLPAEQQVIMAFTQYGYLQPASATALTALIQAFQMHFRPQNYSGVLDAETCAMVYALNEKYGAR